MGPKFPKKWAPRLSGLLAYWLLGLWAPRLPGLETYRLLGLWTYWLPLLWAYWLPDMGLKVASVMGP